MRITLGLSLDGQRAIRPSNRLSDIDVGPLGLLDLLETFLGLTAPVAPTAERVIQYRDCLARSLTDHRFYTRSFRTDELGTAALLLEWRDTWRLAGWTGSFIDPISEKYGLAFFFMIYTVIPILSGLIIWALTPKIKKMMHGIE